MRSPPLVTIPHYSIPGICWGGGLIHYQWRAGDALQLTLHFSFRARLTRGVAMTPNVKSGRQLFLGLQAILNLGASAEVEPAIGDGCSGGSPWGGDHRPGLRRGPAAVAARVSSTSLVTPSRGHHTGAAPLPRP